MAAQRSSRVSPLGLTRPEASIEDSAYSGSVCPAFAGRSGMTIVPFQACREVWRISGSSRFQAQRRAHHISAGRPSCVPR